MNQVMRGTEPLSYENHDAEITQKFLVFSIVAFDSIVVRKDGREERGDDIKCFVLLIILRHILIRKQKGSFSFDVPIIYRVIF